MDPEPEKTNEEIIQEIERLRKANCSPAPRNEFERGVNAAYDTVEIFIAGRIRSLYDENGDLILQSHNENRPL